MTTTGFVLERFPITWHHAIGKELLKIKMLEQVLIEKVCQLFRNLPKRHMTSVSLFAARVTPV